MVKPKENRKRKHKQTPGDVDYETNVPRSKFRPFDEKAQLEEEQLTKILFGGTSSFLQSLEEAGSEPSPSSYVDVDSGVGDDDESNNGNDSPACDRKPAWFDDDDDGIEVGAALEAQGRKLPPGGINERTNKYSSLLAHKFAKSVGTPSWAALDKPRDSDADSDEEIQRTCGYLKKTIKANVPAGQLEYKKVKDLNCETYSEGPFINAVEFHPTSSVALVCGVAGVASLYAVDGKRNSKLHSIGFERYPILCAKFAQNGNEAILGSRHSHLFSYDLLAAKSIRMKLPSGLTQFKKFVVSPDSKFISVAGKWGEVHVLAAMSKERVSLLKQDSDVTALAYNPSGNLLFGHSDSGDVTVWDMTMRRVIHKFTDEGCLQGTTLDVSSSNQFLAAGSAQGVVNLYGMEDVLRCKLPKPRKTILNLTTGITDLKFNQSSEILAFSSIDIPSSIKLYHLASSTVYSNFPTFGSKFGHVTVMNFSPGSGYLAFGNRKSTVALYRLKHFKNY